MSGASRFSRRVRAADAPPPGFPAGDAALKNFRMSADQTTALHTAVAHAAQRSFVQLGLSAKFRRLKIDQEMRLPAGANRSGLHTIAKNAGIKISYAQQADGSVILWRVS